MQPHQNSKFEYPITPVCRDWAGLELRPVTVVCLPAWIVRLPGGACRDRLILFAIVPLVMQVRAESLPHAS